MSKKEANFLSPEEKSVLLKAHKSERDGRKKDRLKFVLLMNEGWSYERIATALFLDDQTLRNYWSEYRKEGIDSLLGFKYQGRSSLLSEQEQHELKEHLKENTYCTAKQIKNYIKAVYGKEYSRKGVIALLHRMGFVHKKAKPVPGKPEVAEQEKFIKLYEALKASLPEDEEILFIDGVHPTHNVKAGYGWILKGAVKQVATNTGRSRININGAYNPRNKEVIFREEEKINAKSTGMLILDIMAKYPSAKKLHIILDNAGYNRAKLMGLFADHSRINLIYLPPYCPNLNLIERLWRFLYKKVTLFRYYNRFSDFREAVIQFLTNTHAYKQELDSLMAENFYIIKPKFSNFISA